jgi:hypothetical protein
MSRISSKVAVWAVLIIHGLGLCHSQLLAEGISCEQPASTETNVLSSASHSEEPGVEEAHEEAPNLSCSGHMVPRSVDHITIDATPIPAFVFAPPASPVNGINLLLREPATHPGVPDVGHLLPLLF